jgi:tetratricopeptide (TPR) repeat protein
MTAHAYDLTKMAVQSYLDAEDIAPSDFRWPYYRGRSLLGAGKAEESATAFRRALEIRESEPWGRLGLGQSLLDLGHYSEARSQFQRVVDERPDEAMAWLGLGDASLGVGETEEALRAFGRVLALQPSASRVHIRLADTYRAMGDLEATAREVGLGGSGRLEYRDPWMLAVVERRRDAGAALTAGTDAFQAGRYLDAAAQFERATKLDPERANAWLNLGVAWVKAGDLENAAGALEESIRLDSSQPEAYFSLGTVRSAQGRTDDAVELLSRALAIDPSHRGAAVNLGNAELRAGRCAEASTAFEEGLVLDPGQIESRLGLVVALSCQERDVEAIEVLGEATPEDPRLRNALARLLAAGRGPGVRDGQRAVEVAKTLIAQETSLEFVETLAMSLAEAGRFEEAIEWQQRALTAARDSGEEGWISILSANLERYQTRRAADRPWGRASGW